MDSKMPDYIKRGAELEFSRRNPETGNWYKMPVKVLTDPMWSATAGPRGDGDWVMQVEEKYPPESRPAKIFETTWASRLHEPEYVQAVTPGQELRQRMRTDDGTLRFGKATAKSGVVDNKVAITYQTKDGVVERTLPHHFLYTVERAEEMLQRVAGSRTPNRGYYQRRDLPNYPPRTPERAEDVEVEVEGLGSDLKTVARAALALADGQPLEPMTRKHLSKIIEGDRPAKPQ